VSRQFPRISIVTPSLNQGAYIEENIKSVLKQKYPNFEHIIIDGGSTDDTIDILKKYDHLIWVSRKDGGQSEAINRGFKMARGEIIGWLNSDDCYEPNTLFTVVKELNRAGNRNVVFGDCYAIDEKGNRIGYFKGNLPHPKDWLKYWEKEYRIPQPSVFFYREVLSRTGYLDEDIHYVMDDEFWLRIREHYQFHYINKPLACARIHNCAKSTLRGWNFEREWFKILRKNWEKLSFVDRYKHLFMALSFRSNLIRVSAYSRMRTAPLGEFRKKILLSLITNPLNLFDRKFLSALFRAIIGHQGSDRIKRLLAEIRFSK
jgi:glycosyltransferase involved in cell wall biosynthesis